MDTVVSSRIKLGRIKNSSTVSKNYCAFGPHINSHNKWFLIGEKNAWRPNINAEEKRNYKLVVCMMEDGIMDTVDDISLTDDGYKSKDILKIIDGVAIKAVEGSCKPPHVWIVVVF